MDNTTYTFSQCYPDCIYRETGAMVNGKIKMERVKQYLEQHVHRKDQDIVSYIVRSFESCLGNSEYTFLVATIEKSLLCFPPLSQRPHEVGQY